MQTVAKICMLACIFYGCHKKPQPGQLKHGKDFVSFELSYTDGWIEKFGIQVDSAGTYFYPKTWDTVFYGRASDTILRYIDTVVAQSGKFRQTQLAPFSCYDCNVIGVEIISAGDTIQFRQSGAEIDSSLLVLVDAFRKLKGRKHRLLKGAYCALETGGMITEKPPLIKE